MFMVTYTTNMRQNLVTIDRATIAPCIHYYLRRRKRLCFHFGLKTDCLSVCLVVSLSLFCPSDNSKSCEWILTKFLGGVRHGPGNKWLNLSDDPDHRPDPGVRNPHSLDYWRSYQRILMKFYGELLCGLETNWLHFGDDPDNHPDPGVRSGSRSGSRKNCHNSIMLAFGGGLSSLSAF